VLFISANLDDNTVGLWKDRDSGDAATIKSTVREVISWKIGIIPGIE
jgi:hypothetical protein